MSPRATFCDPYGHLLPQTEDVPNAPVPTSVWYVDQSISQLAYLTHSYFRYYGKFPSTVAAQVIEDYPAPAGGMMLDNFAGSGTSLVEASRRGIASVGLDINPLGVLAGRVKTEIYDVAQIESILRTTLNIAMDAPIEPLRDQLDSKTVDKWFDAQGIDELCGLAHAISQVEDLKARDFLSVAYLAVIRRLSYAYDGEVRPHFNPNKPRRSPFLVFEKKAREMLAIQSTFNQQHPDRTPALTLVADATSHDYLSRIPAGRYWLVISHPPYLNCFDYMPVYRLETTWGQLFPWIWEGRELKQLRAVELRAWPAAKQQFVDEYYERLVRAYSVTAELQQRGDRLAVVIGDCTIRGELEPVLDKLGDALGSVGYALEKVNHRTTHYGIGKYAYSHRADYHGAAAKKDGILIFRRR